VVGILFENPGHSAVFQCEPEGHFCLKLIKSRRIFAAEKLAYEQLCGPAKDLFLPIYFFFQVFAPPRPSVATLKRWPQVRFQEESWQGYFMRQGQHSLRDILYKPLRFSQDEHDALLSFMLREKELALSADRQHPAVSTGVPVRFKPTQTVQLSLSLAALQLLRRLHAQGWAHGDSHLGNFVYMAGTLYAIDCERTYATSEPVQHLLDIQELFGHISSIMIRIQAPNEWDMRDIQAIYFHR
jgi:hypothetical protein